MGVEERHGEADLVATTACFGAAGIDGELDGDRCGLRLDLGFPMPNREREKGEKGRAG